MTSCPTALHSNSTSVCNKVLAIEMSINSDLMVIFLSGCLSSELNMMNSFFRSGTLTVPTALRLASSSESS